MGTTGGFQFTPDGDRISASSIGFKVLFDDRLAISPDMALAKLLATETPSAGSEEVHAWLGAPPPLVEWLGERIVSHLRASSYTIVNKRYANAITVQDTDLADDKLGLIGLRIQQMADAAAYSYVKLCFNALVAGFTTNCYDGQPFFSASHKDGAGPTQSNLLTATLDDSGAYDSAYEKMLEIQNENGEPFGSKPTHLVVGPSNRRLAADIVAAERLASGASNTNYKSTELIVASQLVGADASKWFLLDLSRPVKPLLLQIRQGLTFVPMAQPDSPQRFMKGVYYYGVEGRHNVGYGLWQDAVGSNGTS